MQGISIGPTVISISATGVNVQPQGLNISPNLIVVGPYDTSVSGQVRSLPLMCSCALSGYLLTCFQQAAAKHAFYNAQSMAGHREESAVCVCNGLATALVHVRDLHVA